MLWLPAQNHGFHPRLKSQQQLVSIRPYFAIERHGNKKAVAFVGKILSKETSLTSSCTMFPLIRQTTNRITHLCDTNYVKHQTSLPLAHLGRKPVSPACGMYPTCFPRGGLGKRPRRAKQQSPCCKRRWIWHVSSGNNNNDNYNCQTNQQRRRQQQ